MKAVPVFRGVLLTWFLTTFLSVESRNCNKIIEGEISSSLLQVMLFSISFESNEIFNFSNMRIEIVERYIHPQFYSMVLKFWKVLNNITKGSNMFGIADSSFRISSFGIYKMIFL